jgi:hypothetical protein
MLLHRIGEQSHMEPLAALSVPIIAMYKGKLGPFHDHGTA